MYKALLGVLCTNRQLKRSSDQDLRKQARNSVEMMVTIQVPDFAGQLSLLTGLLENDVNTPLTSHLTSLCANSLSKARRGPVEEEVGEFRRRSEVILPRFSPLLKRRVLTSSFLTLL